ncbi:MAG: sulfotransferase domain-containing protein [Candidatus Thermoplasmatota archaeon]
MDLKKNVNYIVSGLERSGTSMLMQILHAADIPIAYDHESRPSDPNNPRGYYELEGGKIINRLIEGDFPFEKYQGIFIKITAYGMKHLPRGNYKVVYSERNIEEILDSMEKMAGEKDPRREETKQAFLKLNRLVKKQLRDREDVDVLFVNYNHILSDPKRDIKKIQRFLDISEEKIEEMVEVVDHRLYRQRKKQ